MFNQAVIDAAKVHALKEFPNEACGLVVGDAYIPCNNTADDPTESFVISSNIAEPYILANTLQAVIHSHPFDVMKEISCPSADDMRSQISFGIPFGIIDTDGQNARTPYWLGDYLLDEPLIQDAVFHHGVRDCYTAVRKWFWQKRGIKLVDMPRDARWWEKSDSDLYRNGLTFGGFERIDVRDLRDGDVFFGTVGGSEVKCVNHAGVYLDNKEDGKGLVYHHLPGRLARREAAMPWLSRAEFAARYTGC